MKIKFEDIKKRKEKHEGFMQNYIQYPIVDRLIYIFLRLGFSGNQVSFLMMVLCIIGGALFLFQNLYVNLIAVYLFIFADHLDYVDGAVARYRKKLSQKGCLMDCIHHILERTAFFIGIGYFLGKSSIFFYFSVYISLLFMSIYSFVLASCIVIDRHNDEKYRKLPTVLLYGDFTEWYKFLYFLIFLVGIFNLGVSTILLKYSLATIAIFQSIRVIAVPYIIIHGAK